jgi:hypothetical protein
MVSTFATPHAGHVKIDSRTGVASDIYVSCHKKESAGGGDAAEGEDIEVVELPLSSAFAAARFGSIKGIRTRRGGCYTPFVAV